MKKNKFLILILFMFINIFSLSGCTNSVSFSINSAYKKLEMYVGESYLLSTNCDDIDENKEVIWTTSDENIATVTKDGEIKAKSAGTAYISAKIDDEHETKLYLIIKELRTIKLSGTQMVVVGKKVTINPNITLNDNESIIWKSSDTSVATVINGEVSGIKPGFAKISAMLSSDNNIYDEINILVRSGDGTQDVVINNIYQETYDYTGSSDLTSFSNKIIETVNNVKDSVIGVSNYKQSKTSLALQGVGSGVVINKENNQDGTYKYTIITNHHVIENYYVLKIYIGGEVDKEFDCEFIKSNKSIDLAILTFNYDKVLPVAEFAGANDTKIGEFVLAVGNPDGYDYYNSVTFGITSFVGRNLDNETATFIQHDAAINPGNSGGALFNIDGKLIGINTIKIAKVTVEGMGFAIDLNTINDFIE